MKTLPAWFRLKDTPGVGNHLFKRLFDTFGKIEAILEADAGALLAVEGITKKTVRAIHYHPLTDAVKKELDTVFREGIRIITMADPDYPSLLRQLPDPPPFLYVDGSIDGDTNNFAVVGSRNATRYGLNTAHKLSAELTAAGIRIISGMARGIDTAAHRGTLSTGGKTVAVLGSGLLKIYPAENKSLYNEIRQNGAVISEFAMTAPPAPHHFPMRNRIISGMTLGTLVVEAARKSGSLITARLAAEQGREVFAVPGSIRSPMSSGAHALIKQGAKLVSCAEDIIEELAPHLANNAAIRSAANSCTTAAQRHLTADPDLDRVLNALDSYPTHIDALSRQTEIAPGKIAGILLELELLGKVRQAPGKLFSICED